MRLMLASNQNAANTKRIKHVNTNKLRLASARILSIADTKRKQTNMRINTVGAGGVCPPPTCTRLGLYPLTRGIGEAVACAGRWWSLALDPPQTLRARHDGSFD